MAEPALLTYKETAERLRVSERTVYRLVADRRLRVLRVRGSSFVTRAEVERYLRAAERTVA